jgi:hypothetical protein
MWPPCTGRHCSNTLRLHRAHHLQETNRIYPGWTLDHGAHGRARGRHDDGDRRGYGHGNDSHASSSCRASPDGNAVDTMPHHVTRL